MQAMERVHVIPDVGASAGPRPSSSRAWLLDAVAFHASFDELYAGVDRAEGLARMRWLATQVWRSTDPATHGYVDRLRTGSADDWEAAYHESHLVDWYRVLMADHLVPAPGVSDARALRRGLSELGWTPAEARRAVYGRELTSLVEALASTEVAGEIGPQLMVDSRGWLGPDDVDHAIARLQGIDPSVLPHGPTPGTAGGGALRHAGGRPRSPRSGAARVGRLTRSPPYAALHERHGGRGHHRRAARLARRRTGIRI